MDKKIYICTYIIYYVCSYSLLCFWCLLVLKQLLPIWFHGITNRQDCVTPSRHISRMMMRIFDVDGVRLVGWLVPCNISKRTKYTTTTYILISLHLLLFFLMFVCALLHVSLSSSSCVLQACCVVLGGRNV